jgi:orotidine-5'-phosphate decarboxylase
MDFAEKLRNISRQNQSLLCIGLDPDPALMPGKIAIYDFNKAIIEATSDLVCAYKPNFAFYEALGDEGLAALKRTVKGIPSRIPVIADAKRGDIGNTSRAYARSLFEVFEFDAATVSPYLGFDSLEPFIAYSAKAIFILCRTSNSGSRDFQTLAVETGQGPRPLYQIVAEKAAQWNVSGNVGLVVGATYPEELKQLRQLHPEMPFLIPGIGAQGGEVASTVKYGVSPGGDKAIINSSRQVLYASRGADFAEAARKVALKLRDEINRYRPGFQLR